MGLCMSIAVSRDAMSEESPGENSVVARVATDAVTARRLGDVLAELFAPGEAVIAAFATGSTGTGGAASRGNKNDLDWTVEIYFQHAPDESAVRTRIGELAGADTARRLAFGTVAKRDWVAASLAGLPPVEAGRFFVHGSHDRQRIPPNRIAIEIEAALAFGTGHHATTRGCLLALDRLLKQYRPRAILDVGTGTGVLAIAAARASHRRVTAGDIDRTSVRVARDNARLNRTAGAIETIVANGVADRRVGGRAPFDLVFGNILLIPLKRLARPLGALVTPGGRIVLSGLLAGEANAAITAYRAVGLVLERRITLDGWTTLVVVRPAAVRPRGDLRPPG
jgi:ribosomal protein L11 methyltransferase